MIFIYKNNDEILNEFGQLMPSIEIMADSQTEADEIYRGYDGSKAENKMRDLHV
jgi:hypothetical protein